jgi:hypothetical protein
LLLLQEAMKETGTPDSIFPVQNFNAHHMVVFVEVEYGARADLFRLDDLGIMQAEINHVGFLIKV